MVRLVRALPIGLYRAVRHRFKSRSTDCFLSVPTIDIVLITSLVRFLVLSVSFQHRSIPCGDEHIIEKRLLLPFKGEVTKRN